MANFTDPRKPGSAPLSEIRFDGSNWQDLSRLRTLAILYRASGTEVDSDHTQSTWVARQFNGPSARLGRSNLGRGGEVVPPGSSPFTSYAHVAGALASARTVC